MQIQLFKRIAENKRCNTLLSVLIVLTAISSHLPVWHLKYIYLLCASALSVIAGVKILMGGSVKGWLKASWIYAALAVYMLALVTCKKVGQIMSGTMDSIITGYGEAVYVLFGALFFGAFSKKKIRLFMVAYVATFVAVFAATGQYTLYDVGGVCRTISLYENPNALSVYAAVALFFGILLAVWTPKWYLKIVYVCCAALGVAAIFNSSSRAMYLGVLAATVLFCAIVFYHAITGKIKISVNARAFAFVLLFVVAAALFVRVYRPLPDNAIISMVEEEPVQPTVPPTEDPSIPTTEATVAPTEPPLSGIDRVTQQGGLTDAAAVKSNIRLLIWKTYIDNVSADGFWGSDPGVNSMFFAEYGRDYAPHNILIYMLFVHGVPGFALFMLLMLYFVKQFFSKKRFTMYYSIMVSCVCALIVYGMFHNLANIAILWCCIGMLNHYKRITEAEK